MANPIDLVTTEEFLVNAGKVAISVDSETTVEMKYTEAQGFIELATVTTGSWADDIPDGTMKCTFTGTAVFEYIQKLAV